MRNFMEAIRLEIDNSVGNIILNRPEKRNALNKVMIGEICRSLDLFNSDEYVRVVVFRAEGNVFSAGADLESIKSLASASFDENLEDSKQLKNLFEKIYNFPKPVISAVSGSAIAGGCGLATVCDISLAKESAMFGYTEVKIGFVAAMVMVFLKDMIGEKQAKDLLYSGKLISAERAEQIGLITKFFADDDFEKEVNSYITKLLENSPQAISTTKKLYNQFKTLEISEALEHAARENAVARSTPDCKEGIAAFLEKRKPSWD
jgi:methylglutaconyl-CoA hydratase